MGKHLRLAGVAALVTIAVVGAAPPALAAGPVAETNVVTTNLVDREDHGHGSPAPATWALDTFTRVVTITGGPVYVIPDVEDSEVDARVADTKSEMPELTLCDLVDYLHLRWNYHAEVTDNGTFLTEPGETLSPNAGEALAGGVPGTFEGGFTADFTAPAHWCTYDPSDVDGKTLAGGDAPSTSKWLESLFGDFTGSSINDDWSWRYITCAGEKWWDAADQASNDGQTDEAGDITGLPCPTQTTEAPAPAPAPNAPAALAVTGAHLSTVIAGGVVLLIAGAALVFGLRRRRA